MCEGEEKGRLAVAVDVEEKEKEVERGCVCVECSGRGVMDDGHATARNG